MPKPNDNYIDKDDLDTIIEVNRKAVELHTEVADQNEEILKKLDKIENMQLKIYVLLVSGVISLIIQVIQLLAAKH